MESNEIKTDFFVVGAPKCGTTSIHQYLSNYDDIFLPKEKELHYFSFPEVTNTYYKVHFVSSLSEYKSYYAGANRKKCVGDVCPSYFYYEKTPLRIYEYNNDAKIIILLRDPIERAISHYLMDISIGYQFKPLSSILGKRNEGSLFFREYVLISKYYSPIKRYLNTFNKVYIESFENFFNDIDAYMNRVADFLGISESFLLEGNKAYNVYKSPRNVILMNLIRRTGLANSAKFFPKMLKNKVKSILYQKKSEKPDFTKEKEILKDLLYHDTKRLTELIDEKIVNGWINSW